MTPSPEASRTKCARRAEAMAWLQGELPREQSDDYDQHVQECEPCTEFVNDARVLLVRLHREAAERRDSGGARGVTVIEQRILEHCEPDLARLQVQARGRARRGAYAAAAVLLLTVTAHVGLRAVRGGADEGELASRVAAVQAVTASDVSAHWIAEQLGPDGRFDAASWTGPRNDEIGMHGLALLALARAGNESPADDASRRAEVLRGARWLMEQQDADGTLGADGEGGGLSHAVATVALLEASELTDEPPVRRAAERAVARIASCQLADGGWQPHAPARGCDPARTAWALQALLRAEQLQVRGLCKAIARGRSRLAADLGGLRRPDELDLQAVARLALGATGPGAAGASGAGEIVADVEAALLPAPGATVPQATCDRAETVTRPAPADTAPDESRAIASWTGRPARLDDLYVASVAVLSALPLAR